MDCKDIYTLLQTLNIPVAYGHFDDDKDLMPPFMVYRETAPNTFKADNKTYFRDHDFEIELVTIKHDTLLLDKIEKLLDENNIPYDMIDEVWDNEEKIYHNFYEI